MFFGKRIDIETDIKICVWVGAKGRVLAGEMLSGWHVIGQPRGLFQARFVVQLRSWKG